MTESVADSTPMQAERLEQLVRERIVSRQLERDRTFGAAIDTAGWMTFAPFIPMSLLNRTERSAADQLVTAGVLRVAFDRFKPGSTQGDLYAPAATGRATVLDYFGRSRGGFPSLRDQVATAARERQTSTVESVTWNRWIKLAAESASREQFVRAFDAAATQAFTTSDAAELLNLIDCVRPLADLATRTFDEAPRSSLERAARQLELLQRRAAQERHLRTFLPRTEQLAAIHDLLRGPDGTWALHLFGVGGMGKTMLLHYVIGELVPSLKASVARVDFDYLNPDYPKLDPGLLLWAFAQELRPYDVEGRANELFDKTDRTLQLLSFELRAASGPHLATPTSNPLFVSAVTSFIDALRALPQPVILILDTCEELAKMRADGHVPHTVEETFRILEAIHDGPHVLRGEVTTRGLPGVRVVFAGRRPLASAGSGWQFPGSRQPARPYLKLHHLLGFTSEEASSYLTGKMQVPGELIDAVIDRSRSVGVTSAIEWTDGRSIDLQQRCNPFDLRLYADWAKEDPRPTEEQIRSATGAEYVEMRILRRLDELPSLRAILPVLAQIRFADAGLIGALVPDARDAELTFETLRQQEWVEERRVHGPDDAAQQVLCLEERLRQRLRAYFRVKSEIDRRLLEIARDYLRQRTLAGSLDELDWTVFSAAARTFVYDVEGAMHWWLAVERRIIDERGYHWLWEVTRALLADSSDAAAENDETTRAAAKDNLRALLMSAYLTACVQIGEAPSPETSWTVVGQAVAALPEGATRNYLARRAKANRTSEAAISIGSPDGSVARSARWMRESRPWPRGSVWNRLQCAASTVQAQALLLDRIERGVLHVPRESPLLAELSGSAGVVALAGALTELLEVEREHESQPWYADAQRLASFSCTLAGRLAAITHEETAAGWFREGIKLAASVSRPFAKSFWDWRAPENALARATLEFVRSMQPITMARLPEIQKMAATVPAATDIDTDRLRSLLTQIRVADAPLSELPNASLDLTPPQCFAHEVTMPLAVACAAHRARLDPDGGLTELTELTVQAGMNVELVLTIERETAKLIRRLRVTEASVSIGEALGRSERPSDQQLVWSFEAHTAMKQPSVDVWKPRGDKQSDKPRTREELLRLHAVWQSYCAVSASSADSALEWGREHLARLSGPTENYVDSLSLELDRCELGALSHAHNRFVAEHLVVRVQQGAVMRHPRLNEHASFVLALRCLALEHVTDGATLAKFIAKRAEKLGLWSAAEIAFDLGDSLLLRLPQQARRLFQLAHDWYATQQDWTGAFLTAVRLAIVPSTKATQSDGSTLAWRLYLDKLATSLKASTPEALQRLARTDASWVTQFVASASPALRPTVIRLIECTRAEAMVPAFTDAAATGHGADFAILAGRRATTSSSGANQVAAPAQEPRVVEMHQAAPAEAQIPPQPPARKPTRLWLRLLTRVAAYSIPLFTLLMGIEYVDLRDLMPKFTASLSSKGPVLSALATAAALAFAAELWSLLKIGEVLARRFASPQYLLRIVGARNSAGSRRESRIQEHHLEVDLFAALPTLQWSLKLLGWRRTTVNGRVVVVSSIDDRSDGRSPPIHFDVKIAKALVLALRERAGPRPLFRMETIAALHEYKWEGALHDLAKNASRRPARVHCVRTSPVAPRYERRAASVPARRALLVLASSSRHLVLTDSLIREARQHPGLARWNITDVNPTKGSAASVIYMLGRIEEGPSGLIFERGIDTPISSDSSLDERMLPAAAILRSAPNVELVILQSEPDSSGDIAVRSVSGRDDEALARTYAAQLCETGARYVLYLPRTNSVLAARFVALLVEFLGTAQISEQELLKLVERAQDIIGAAQHPYRKDLAELAAGIALFISNY
jgi:hypothetical protein